jgi:regulator of protease activity HflC (stomatin/prohibitin superfamily)
MNNRTSNNVNPIPWVVAAVFLACILIAGGMVGCPKYEVWQQGQKGLAELKRAEQNRQISINESKAKKEAATFEADAEIERARGIAQANKVIGDSLKGNEGYLRWLYIDMLRETGGQGRETIYIPTEAGMPIMEATRLQEGPVIHIDK